MAMEPEPDPELETPGDDGYTADDESQEKIEEDAIAKSMTPVLGRSASQAATDEVELQTLTRSVARRSLLKVTTDVLNGTDNGAGKSAATAGATDPQVEALKDVAKSIRETLAPKDKGNLFARNKGVTLIFGATTTLVGIAGVVVAAIAIARAESNQDPLPGNPDPGLTDDQKAQIVAMVQRWWALPDSAVWDAVIAYVNQWNPDLQTQIIIMDTFVLMSQPLDPPWTWRTGADEWAAIESLTNAYASAQGGVGQSRSRAFYEGLKTYTYDGLGFGAQTMPRIVAAATAKKAIYWVFNQQALQAPAGGHQP